MAKEEKKLDGQPEPVVAQDDLKVPVNQDADAKFKSLEDKLGKLESDLKSKDTIIQDLSTTNQTLQKRFSEIKPREVDPSNLQSEKDKIWADFDNGLISYGEAARKIDSINEQTMNKRINDISSHVLSQTQGYVTLTKEVDSIWAKNPELRPFEPEIRGRVNDLLVEDNPKTGSKYVPIEAINKASSEFIAKIQGFKKSEPQVPAPPASAGGERGNNPKPEPEVQPAPPKDSREATSEFIAERQKLQQAQKSLHQR